MKYLMNSLIRRGESRENLEIELGWYQHSNVKASVGGGALQVIK